MYSLDASGTVPRTFCWSRIGDEAGQGIALILQRKDLERRATGGQFIWGIGSALGPAMGQLVTTNADPQVLFSPIRRAAAPHDRAPGGVLMWTCYIDKRGREAALPENVLITSRAETLGGVPKRSHYALFCESKVALCAHQVAEVDFAELRNLATHRPVGFSQVTAVVERVRTPGISLKYPVAFSAHLVAPFCARLAGPVLARATELASVEAAVLANNLDAYRYATNKMRQRGDDVARRSYQLKLAV